MKNNDKDARAGIAFRLKGPDPAIRPASLEIMPDIETPAPTREEIILDGLNEAQRGAVLHGDGPLLIVAGAGTGKTTVLTRRIAHLITTKRARPEEILALTFTEKAAREMSERVDQLVPYGYTESFIATFHAFGDRMLREHCFTAGLKADFRVLSRADEIVFLRHDIAAGRRQGLRPCRYGQSYEGYQCGAANQFLHVVSLTKCSKGHWTTMDDIAKG